ncbi:MAG: DUF3368 domain-containing protein [Microbacteriaceae bacterium]|nr:DUF3368 domain-containing protein [Microbacteriaceae bacterium]
MGSAIVADAGPLIAFGRVERIALLQQVLGEVLVPHTVIAECVVDPEKPGAREITEAIRAKLLVKVGDPPPAPVPFPVLGPGESAAIRLALKLDIPVLIDERLGRKITTNLGLTVVGSGGVLLSAKRRGLIDTVKPTLDTLAASGYHFSDALRRAILSRAGEH